MSGKALCVLVTLLAAMVLSAGCQRDNIYIRDPDAQALEASENVLVPDVPFPMGFKVTEERSRESAGSRNIYLILSGQATAAQLIDFYRDRKMPINDWLFEEQVADFGVATLVFRKATERCTITIKEGSFSTELRIQVIPVGSVADGD